MFLKFIFFGFIFFYTKVCSCIVDDDFNLEIITLCKKKCKLDDNKLLLVFNNLQAFGFTRDDLILLNYDDFVVFFIEYVFLRTYGSICIDAVLEDIDFVEKNKKSFIVKICNHFEEKQDSFLDSLLIEKVKLYLECKKSNQAVDSIVKTSLIFIVNFYNKYLDS